MQIPRSFRLALAAAFLFLGSSLTHGQASTGAMTGVVSDPTGAPVPNVQISVVQVDTNIETRSVTNNEGLYMCNPCHREAIASRSRAKASNGSSRRESSCASVTCYR